MTSAGDGSRRAGGSEGFVARLRARAKQVRRKVVFPETDDDRTLAAIEEMVRLELVTPVLVVRDGGSLSLIHI